MGLVVFGQGVAKISGKVGGSVFAHNAGGNYVRNWNIPTDPNTARQAAARTNLALLANNWENLLSQAQRDEWDLYGANVDWLNRVGDVIHLSGINHYIRSNTAIILAGGDVIDDAPASFTLGTEDPTFAITASEATQLISVTFDESIGWSAQDDGFLPVHVGAPQNAGITFFKSPFRFAAALRGNLAIPLTSPQDIATPYPFVAGQRLFVKARTIFDDARISGFFWSDVITSA